MNPAPSDGARLCRFGPYDVDLRARELRKNGYKLKVHGTPFELLAALVERPGEVVTREELFKRLWPEGTFVDFDNNLNSAVKRLRDALGDNAEQPQYIETLPRLGYRFVAAVEEVAPLPAPAPEGQSASPVPHFAGRITGHEPRWSAGTAVAVIAVLAVAGVIGWKWFGTRASAGRETLLVLPFHLPESQQENPLGLAVADSLICQLRGTPNLSVLPLSAGYPYRRLGGDARVAGRQAGATLVLTGSAARLGSQVQVQANLIRAADGERLWGHAITFAEESFPHAQAAIPAALLRELGGGEAANNGRAGCPGPGTSLAAYENYHEGKYQLALRTSAGISRAMDSFELAMGKDSQFVPARTGLAVACAFDLQKWPQAEQLAQEALQLDARSSEAHAVLGFIRMFWQRDWERARREFQQAVDLDPQNATARHWYGLYFLAQSKGGEAKAELDTALKLDPFSPAVHTDMGELRILAGHLDEAMSSCNQALAIDPDFLNAHICVYRIHLHRRRAAEARAKLREIQERFDRNIVFAMESNVLAEEAALQGRESEALHWLEEAYKVNSLSVVYAGSNPAFANLLKYPRYRDLLRKLALRHSPAPSPSGNHAASQRK